MIEKIYDKPEIYKIDVPLPDNPLKNLNCYVVKTPEKNLIIDTGFNRDECYFALTEGLSELEIDIDRTEMFLTHLHADHTGLAGRIMKPESTVYMGSVDYAYLRHTLEGDYWEKTDLAFGSEGFPTDALAPLHKTNPARIFTMQNLIHVTEVEDGDKIQIGGYDFICISTPGHTPGHFCLYLESEKIMFLGDHVLFDITPNITNWHMVHNSLKKYLESLEKISSYDIALALPAHRKNEMNVYERIGQIQEHHKKRLQNTVDILREKQGQTAHDIASKMKWSMRGKDWSEFPMSQKWFAVGETIAHLDYLIDEHSVQRQEKDGIHYYYLIK